MEKLWQSSHGDPKPAFSKNVQRGDQGKFFKNRRKSSPRLKGPKALWRKWPCPLISMHLVQRLDQILAEATVPKPPEWKSYGNLRMVTQNPHFLKTCKGGTKGNFSKIAQKSSLRFKGPKALWRKWYYPLISMRLKCQDWTRSRCKKGLQNCLNGQVRAIFERSPKTRIFWKGGTKENFSKIAHKLALIWKTEKHSDANGRVR